MSTLGALLHSTGQRLARAGIADARLEAELVWMTALDIDRATLYVELQEEPPASGADTAEALIVRRLRREPMAYLMGKREFYGLSFHVAPGVLVPRPDTETLVEEALRLLQSRGPVPLEVADVGCGTGIIGISLAVALPNVHVYAIDIADPALEVTTLNAERLDVSARVTVLKGDLLAPLPGRVDMITANLPYVPSKQVSRLEPEISLYEPREALDGGDDGLDVVRRLLDDVPRRLSADGWVLLELDPRQMRRARTIARRPFPAARIVTQLDLTRRERVLIIDTSLAESASGLAFDQKQQPRAEEHQLHQANEDLLRDAGDDPAASEAASEHDGADDQANQEKPQIQ